MRIRYARKPIIILMLKLRKKLDNNMTATTTTNVQTLHWTMADSVPTYMVENANGGELGSAREILTHSITIITINAFNFMILNHSYILQNASNPLHSPPPWGNHFKLNILHTKHVLTSLLFPFLYFTWSCFSLPICPMHP